MDNRYTIFLDMDGVIADFNSAVLELFGRTMKDMEKDWPAGQWEVTGPLGVSELEFYKTIYDAGEDFWVNIKPYDHLDELWEGIQKYGDVYICTAPIQDPRCLSGKIKWLQKYIGKGEWVDNVIICRDKHLLAGYNRILVDDSDKNINRFLSFGGKAVTFPRRWNKLYRMEDEAVHCTFNMLDMIRYNINGEN